MIFAAECALTRKQTKAHSLKAVPPKGNGHGPRLKPAMCAMLFRWTGRRPAPPAGSRGLPPKSKTTRLEQSQTNEICGVVRAGDETTKAHSLKAVPPVRNRERLLQARQNPRWARKKTIRQVGPPNGKTTRLEQSQTNEICGVVRAGDETDKGAQPEGCATRAESGAFVAG